MTATMLLLTVMSLALALYVESYCRTQHARRLVRAHRARRAVPIPHEAMKPLPHVPRMRDACRTRQSRVIPPYTGGDAGSSVDWAESQRDYLARY